MSTHDPVPDDSVPDLLGGADNHHVLILRDEGQSTSLESLTGAEYTAEVARLDDDTTTESTATYDVVVFDLRAREDVDAAVRQHVPIEDASVVFIAASTVDAELEQRDDVVRLDPPVSANEFNAHLTELTRRQTYRELLELDYRVTSQIHRLTPDGQPGWLAESPAVSRLVEQKRAVQAALDELEGEFTEGDYAAIFATGFQ